MRSKEVEEAIDKTKQLKQGIKEKGKDFRFYDNENAVIGYECLKTALNYIEELEKLPNKIRDKIEEYKKKIIEAREEDDDNKEFYYEQEIEVLKELLEEEK